MDEQTRNRDFFTFGIVLVFAGLATLVNLIFELSTLEFVCTLIAGVGAPLIGTSMIVDYIRASRAKREQQ